MRDLRPLPHLCSALIACATLAVSGCSDQSQAGDDPAGRGATGALSAQVATPETGAVGSNGNAPPSQGQPDSADAAAEDTGDPTTPSEPDCASVAASSYPTDAPYYPAATTLTTCRSSDGRIKQISTAPNSGEVIYAHMTRSLEVQGWAIQSKMAQNGQFVLDATKANRRAAVLIADREIVEAADGSTRITVLVTP